LGPHAGALQVVAFERPDHGGGRVVGAADDDRNAAIAEAGENAGGPACTMRVDDEGGNIVERNAAAFFRAGSHRQETTMHGERKIVGFDVDHAFHGSKRS
jgi:hypothetical protein